MLEISPVFSILDIFSLTSPQAHYLTGKYEDALMDAEKDLSYKHDGSAYVLAGIISYKLEVGDN